MNITKKTIIIFFFAVFVFVWSIVNPFGYAPDYFQYDLYFDNVRSGNLSDVLAYRFEPGFSILVYLFSRYFDESVLILACIATLSTTIKMSVSYSYGRCESFFLIAFLFFFKFFPLHELNQLRAAVCVAFLFLIYKNLDSKNIKIFALSVIAISFHYSAIIVLPFLFLIRVDYSRFNILIISFLIFIFSKIFSIFLVDFSSIYFSAVASYKNQGLNSISQSAFSPVFFPEFFMIFGSLILWGQCTSVMRKIVAFEIFGFALFYGLIDLDVFAVRSREIFSVFWLIFVAQLSFVEKQMKFLIFIFTALSVAVGVYVYYFTGFFSHEIRWVIGS